MNQYLIKVSQNNIKLDLHPLDKIVTAVWLLNFFESIFLQRVVEFFNYTVILFHMMHDWGTDISHEKQ